MFRRLFLLTLVFSLFVASAAFPVQVLAAPTSSATLNSSSGCGYGLLNVATAGFSGGRELWRATTSTGTLLGEAEQSHSGGTSYNGLFGFPFSHTVPNGTIVILYGYIGSTPPSADTTAEFSVTYRCDTREVIASCAGPYGSCTVSTSVTRNFMLLDGRLNNSTATDTGAPVVLYKNGDRLLVIGIGGGISQELFGINDAQITADGSTNKIAHGNIPGNGQPVTATLQGDGTLLLEAFYQDGKPYTLIYDPKAPSVQHVAW